ncbi:MAG: serine/threonine-protein kinase [Acidobacteriota bacterium]
MTLVRQRRVMEVLDATLAEPPKSRPAFLQRVCGEDEALRREVESLLDLEEEADSFLPEPAVALDGGTTLEKGNRIGPYRILDLLGRGGMGAVYRAVREDDFEKQVALKLLQRDLVSEATVRRFHNERQILARLEHPSIARLLDGGTTPDGRPFLVMEYVEGVPVDEYCDEHHLSTRKRLELFLRICSALAFAHQNLVVHRDLKPGNILITPEGAPKLLDFGIAKLLGDEDAVRRDLTYGNEQPMTPRFASPEQVQRQPITTASDIYALGSLLYRLLTGRLPCGLESCRFGEIGWRIVEKEAVKPSVTVTRTEEIQTTAGVKRWTPELVSLTREGDADRLRRSLAGDVDAILLKALRKEPQHRYASVEQFAEDVRRHLVGLPVAARKGTLLYLGSKFVQRHRWGLAAALTLLLAATGLLIREGQRLQDERQRAERVTVVLRELLSLGDPDLRDDASMISTLESVRDGLAVLEAEPELRSELLLTLGRIHHARGNADEARETSQESLDLWQENLPERLEGLAIRFNNLAALDLDEGDYAAAEQHLRESLRLRDRLGDTSQTYVVNLNNLATALLYQGDPAGAEELYRKGLEIRERLLGRDDPQVARSLRSVGAVLHAQSKSKDAEPLVREALAIRLRAYGPDHTGVASVLDLLGRIRLAQGDHWEAEKYFHRALEILRAKLASDHPHLVWSERNLGLVVLAEGDLVAARAMLTRAYHVLSQTRRPGHWRLAATKSDVGALLAAEGRFEEAESCLLEGHSELRDVRGDDHAYTRTSRQRIAELYESWGDPERKQTFEVSIGEEQGPESIR